MRPPEQVKRELIQQWLTKAEEDFSVVEYLLSEDTAYLSAIGFHAQQAAEKFLKSLLWFGTRLSSPKPTTWMNFLTWWPPLMLPWLSLCAT